MTHSLVLKCQRVFVYMYASRGASLHTDSDIQTGTQNDIVVAELGAAVTFLQMAFKSRFHGVLIGTPSDRQAGLLGNRPQHALE